MDNDGKFISKRAIGSPINDDVSGYPVFNSTPVVFSTNGNLYISYITRKGNVDHVYSTYLETYLLDNSFNVTNSTLLPEVSEPVNTSIGIIMSAPYLTLISTTISPTINSYYFDTSNGWLASTSYTAQKDVASANALETNGKIYFALSITNTTNSYHIEMGVVSNFNQNISSIANTDDPFYSPNFSDAYPFIDPVTLKVYFSRLAEDDDPPNYDLYRYNDTTASDIPGFNDIYIPPSSIIHPNVSR
jgi:hypothetical protein